MVALHFYSYYHCMMTKIDKYHLLSPCSCVITNYFNILPFAYAYYHLPLAYVSTHYICCRLLSLLPIAYVCDCHSHMSQRTISAVVYYHTLPFAHDYYHTLPFADACYHILPFAYAYYHNCHSHISVVTHYHCRACLHDATKRHAARCITQNTNWYQNVNNERTTEKIAYDA
jgi:hypothetical protein